MTDFVVSSSSLEPIDLAATAFYFSTFVHNVNDHRLYVIFDDTIDVPTNKESRLLVSHYSLSLHQLTVDPNNVLRQIFLPLESNVIQKHVSDIRAISSHVAGIFATAGLPLYANALKARVEALAGYLIATYGETIVSPSDLLQSMIKYLLGDIAKVPVTIYCYSKMISSRRENNLLRNVVVRIAQAMFSQAPGATFTFVRGGSIDIVLSNKIECRLIHGSVLTDKVIFTTEQLSMQPARLEVSLNNGDVIFQWDGNIITDYTLDLRGPLNLAVYSSFGNHLHLPWYCGSENIESVVKTVLGVETISPITVATPERCSRSVGGHGKRLQPSGYSLIEYNNPAVNALVSHVARFDVTASHLTDWIYFINNYPMSSQKGSKHQGGVNAYIAFRESSMRRTSEAEPLRIFHLPDSRNVPQLGQTIIAFMVLLRFLKKWDVYRDESTAKIHDICETVGWLSGDQLVWNKLRNDTIAMIEISSAWRLAVLSRPKDSKAEGAAIAEDHKYVTEIELGLQTGKWRRPGRRTKGTECGCIGDILLQELHVEVALYYQTVLALSCTVLKATLWNSWLCMNADEYRQACLDLISKRNDGGKMEFSGQLWYESRKGL